MRLTVLLSYCVCLFVAPDVLRGVGIRASTAADAQFMSDHDASGSTERVDADLTDSYRVAVSRGMTHHQAHFLEQNTPAERVTAVPLTRRIKASPADTSGSTFNSTKTRSNAYVGICAIVKNEQRNLQEWIDYHHWIGVGKIYIFDHGSSLSVAAQLNRYISAGEFFVVVIIHPSSCMMLRSN